MNAMKPFTNARRTQAGFSMIELLVATVVLLFGVVAVMQLVPRAIQANLDNRMNTTSTVIAQRLMDLITNAGVGANTLVDPTGTFPCGALNVCNLGGGAVVGDFTAGAALLPNGNIDFNAAPVAGFRLLFTDPNDPTGAPYDIRWAVITSVRNVGPISAIPVAKRYIIGVMRTNGRDPVTITSWATR
jgi:prepilin-type N-terminal cleavage/methylation domain-containing protein